MTGQSRWSDGALRHSMSELSPFERRGVPEVPLGARLLRRESPAIALVALENLLASAKPLELSNRHISRIEEEYRLSSTSASKVHLALYAKAYRTFVSDNRLTDSQVSYLLDLQRLLVISDDDVVDIERETIIPRFEDMVTTLIEEGIVTLDERAAIDQLANDLRVAPSIRQELHSKPMAQALNKALAQRLTNRKLTDDEFDEFVEIARHLGIHPSFDNATAESMHRCAFLWRIEAGEFPIIRAAIQLHDDELCHFATPARWLESRSRSFASSQYAPDATVRVARGVAYRVGGSRPRRLTVDELAEVDTGTLYLTSQRVIFQGTDHSFAQALETLKSVDVFADGIAFERDADRHPHLVLDDHAEAAAVLLTSLLRETPASHPVDNAMSRSNELTDRHR
jgi:hypothetical protein